MLQLLRSLDRDELAALLTWRRVATRGAAVVMDVAELLVSPESVREAASRMSWQESTRALAGDAAALQRARLRGLAAGEGTAPELLDEVRSELARIIALDSPTAGAEPPTAPPLPQSAERAHSGAQLAADAIASLDSAARSFRASRHGVQFGATTSRRIATELDADPAAFAVLLDWMLALGLCAPLGDSIRPTAAGRAFRLRPAADRWAELAAQWLGEISTGQRLGLLTASSEAAAPVTELLGITLGGAMTTLGAQLLDDDLAGASATLRGAVPDDVAGVYLQPDLSIIAPGPLEPADEQALQSVAKLERRGLASTYRLSEASIAHALGSGSTVDDVRDVLARLSLTGIPQPAEYLLRETAARHGKVRVREREDGSGSIVSCPDEALLAALRVDAATTALALRPYDTGSLATAASRDTAVLILLDARYPASAEDRLGNLVPLRPHQTAEPLVEGPTPSAARFAASLLDDAANIDTAGDELTWIQRQLEIAKRDKAEVDVRVAVSATSEVVLRLVPTSVAAGRLRARDLAADVERTVPLRAVLEVAPVSDATPG